MVADPITSIIGMVMKNLKEGTSYLAGIDQYYLCVKVILIDTWKIFKKETRIVQTNYLLHEQPLIGFYAHVFQFGRSKFRCRRGISVIWSAKGDAS